MDAESISFHGINHPPNGVGWHLLMEQVGLFAAKRVAFLHVPSFSGPGGIRLPPSSIHRALKPRMPSNAILSLLHDGARTHSPDSLGSCGEAHLANPR